MRSKLAAAEIEVAKGERKYGAIIEHHVRPLVVALTAHEFPTVASCGGHVERMRLYPWVKMYNRTIHGTRVPNTLPDNFSEDDYVQWAETTMREVDRLDDLLKRFYKGLEEGPLGRYSAHRLEVWHEWKNGPQSLKASAFPNEYYLQCGGSQTLSTLPEALLAGKEEEILERNRREFTVFAYFLSGILK